MSCLTQNQLDNAQQDILAIESIVNGPATGAGSTTTTRLGRTIDSLAKVLTSLNLLGILTNKGDLLAFGTNNSRLPVGSNGQVLIADSTQTLGLRWANSRELLTGNRNYYVRPDGNNANSGLANTSDGAWLTLQRAMDYIAANIDVGPYIVTVNIADGTYTGGLTLKSYARTSGYVSFVGNTSGTITGVVLSTAGHCISNAAGATGFYDVRGIQLRSSTRNAINLLGPGVDAQFGSMNFGACSGGVHCFAQQKCRINFLGTNYVSGNAVVGFWATRQAQIFFSGTTINYTTAVAYAARNFSASEQGWIDAFAVTFAGSASSVTGKRYDLGGLAGIFTNGGGANYIPGDSAGTGNGTNGAVYY